MSPNPAKTKAAVDAARAAKAAAEEAASNARATLSAAEHNHSVHEAAAYILAKPGRLDRLRELVARGSAFGEATPLDRAMSERAHHVVLYEPASKGHRSAYGRVGAHPPSSAPGHLAAAVLTLIDAPETP
jgi:multidrug resistance efflux pump